MARDLYLASDLRTRKVHISDGWRSDFPIRVSASRTMGARVLYDQPELWPVRWRSYAARALRQPETLTITADDIAEARQRRAGAAARPYDSTRDCPIGIALAREFGAERGDVRAHPDYLSVKYGAETAIPILDTDGSKRGSIWDRREYHFASTPTIRALMRNWDRRARAEPRRVRLLPR